MTPSGDRCTSDCACTQGRHDPQLVVVTGGPGAGKTAVLEMARRSLCRHVIVLPEAAGIVFGGGFPRRSSGPARQAAQRAIFHIQRELEQLHLDEQDAAWRDHPRRTVIESTVDFPTKAIQALTAIGAQLPACCDPVAL